MCNKNFDNIWTMMKNPQFNRNTLNELSCELCKKLLINPHKTKCGCKFCYQCAESYLKDGKKFCPRGTEKCMQEYMYLDHDFLNDDVTSIAISKIVAKCPKSSCKKELELSTLAKHYSSCQAMVISCPYEEIGCMASIESEEDLAKHLATEAATHSSLMVDAFGNDRNQMKSMEISFKSQLRSQKSVMNKIVFGKKVDFVLTVDDISNKRGCYSAEPFYKDQYKFCMSIWFSDKISLWVAIMKGRNDHILRWPMLRTITLSIVNQESSENYESFKFHHNSHTRKHGFCKPEGDKNACIGKNDCANLKEMKEHPGVIVDDSIVVTCSIE